MLTLHHEVLQQSVRLLADPEFWDLASAFMAAWDDDQPNVPSISIIVEAFGDLGLALRSSDYPRCAVSLTQHESREVFLRHGHRIAIVVHEPIS
jgi:hypothetical protein